MKIEAIYGLEWEYKALQEMKDCLIRRWENNRELFRYLHDVHFKLLDVLAAKNVQAVDIPFEFKDKEHSELFSKIRDFVYLDPYLALIFVYCRTTPQDIDLRQYLNWFLTVNIIDDTWMFYQNLELLRNSELSKRIFYKEKPVASIPSANFITGRILSFLFLKYNHFYKIDRVKQSGARESIDELRRNRIYESSEGTVYDYTPFYKHTITKNGICHIFEVFSQEQYDFLIKKTSQFFDEMLCGMMKNLDSRRDLSFGNDLNTSTVSLIVRFGTNEKKIPLQLLPRYKNLVTSIKRRYTLTKIAADEKEDETQEAMTGLFEGAVTWDKNKGEVSSWLKQKTEWHLGDAFDKISADDSKTRKRKLMEKIDAEGGSLDESISDESTETKGESRKDDRNEPIEDMVAYKDGLAWLATVLEKHPKMKTIVEKENKGESLTQAERQYKKWFIDKYKE